MYKKIKCQHNHLKSVSWILFLKLLFRADTLHNKYNAIEPYFVAYLSQSHISIMKKNTNQYHLIILIKNYISKRNIPVFEFQLIFHLPQSEFCCVSTTLSRAAAIRVVVSLMLALSYTFYCLLWWNLIFTNIFPHLSVSVSSKPIW